MLQLEIKNISKSFGNKAILSNISFTVEKGSITTLAGESGCGKTTLLRIIAGLEIADKGQIKINQSDITYMKPEKRNIGLVFQNLALFPHMTVFENIAFPVNINKTKNKAEVLSLMKMLEIENYSNQYPHQLSGGQQQRVALARVLINHPKLLLLDEPFSNLDEIIKNKVRQDLLAFIKSLGITTIIVSHQANDSYVFSDKVVLLKNGEILQIDSPQKIYSQPKNAYIGTFFGNFIQLDAKIKNNKIVTPFGIIENIFGITKNECKICCRPEHIVISQNPSDFKGFIKQIIFKGQHELLIIEDEEKKHILEIETEYSNLSVGNPIFFSLKSDKIMIF